MLFSGQGKSLWQTDPHFCHCVLEGSEFVYTRILGFSPVCTSVMAYGGGLVKVSPTMWALGLRRSGLAVGTLHAGPSLWSAGVSFLRYIVFLLG